MTCSLSPEPLQEITNPYLVFSHLPAPQKDLQVSVIVPVRNEALHLWNTLTALCLQEDEMDKPLAHKMYEVILLANNCTDTSAQIARQFADTHPHFQLHVAEISLPAHRANIGTVRRMLMDEACRRLRTAGCVNGIIASTDGDTIAHTQWVYRTIQAVQQGADAVGGRILTHPMNGPLRRWHLRDVTYRTLLSHAEAIIDPQEHDPWPRHFQYFGASLAVTCRAYEKAGRLPELPFLEDSAFYEALMRTDARVRRTNLVKVFTSARTQGRVAVGLSEQLHSWNYRLQQGEIQMVPCIREQLHSFLFKKQLRECHTCFSKTGVVNSSALKELALAYDLEQEWLHEQMSNPVFGDIWQQIQYRLKIRKTTSEQAHISIIQAIAALRSFITQRR